MPVLGAAPFRDGLMMARNGLATGVASCSNRVISTRDGTGIGVQ